MAIKYIDRLTGKCEIEKVYGETALKFLYESTLGAPFRELLARVPLFSAVFGWWQKRPFTRKKIAPFIRDFGIDSSEFLENSFPSFNDFFIRKLKPEARPIASSGAVMPADGRYLFYPDLTEADGFVIKGRKFDLGTLLQNAALAAEYQHGTMVMARLCPSDYHRFHFPCTCLAGETQRINGPLYSVNPFAIKRAVQIFTENRRTLCELQSEAFGKVLYLEIGATNVGSIHETYPPHTRQMKGAEKGYFSFGGSSLILLFPPGSLALAPDLLQFPPHVEVRCLMGQVLGDAS